MLVKIGYFFVAALVGKKLLFLGSIFVLVILNLAAISNREAKRLLYTTYKTIILILCHNGIMKIFVFLLDGLAALTSEYTRMLKKLNYYSY